MIIGHIATHYGVQRAGCDRRGIAELITAPFRWQPGWAYEVQS